MITRVFDPPSSSWTIAIYGEARRLVAETGKSVDLWYCGNLTHHFELKREVAFGNAPFLFGDPTEEEARARFQMVVSDGDYCLMPPSQATGHVRCMCGHEGWVVMDYNDRPGPQWRSWGMVGFVATSFRCQDGEPDPPNLLEMLSPLCPHCGRRGEVFEPSRAGWRSPLQKQSQKLMVQPIQDTEWIKMLHGGDVGLLALSRNDGELVQLALPYRLLPKLASAVHQLGIWSERERYGRSDENGGRELIQSYTLVADPAVRGQPGHRTLHFRTNQGFPIQIDITPRQARALAEALVGSSEEDGAELQ
jgi:hypothetical protein